MTDGKPNGRMREDGRTHRLAHVGRLESIPTDWHWLDALSPSCLDCEFSEAVEERAEDQERPLLESLFD